MGRIYFWWVDILGLGRCGVWEGPGPGPVGMEMPVHVVGIVWVCHDVISWGMGFFGSKLLVWRWVRSSSSEYSHTSFVTSRLQCALLICRVDTQLLHNSQFTTSLNLHTMAENSPSQLGVVISHMHGFLNSSITSIFYSKIVLRAYLGVQN